MNKGSHISLALFLLEREELKGLNQHRRALLMGSILPDCLPSFLTTRHTITETFELVKAEIHKLSGEYHKQKGISKSFCIHLGMVLHYLADYFTTPHNPGFSGTVRNHIDYERALQVYIQCYFENGVIVAEEQDMEENETLFEYIVELHNQYLNEARSLITDCEYITRICYQAAKILMKGLKIPDIAEEREQEVAA